jgi:small GTP-binding protein
MIGAKKFQVSEKCQKKISMVLGPRSMNDPASQRGLKVIMLGDSSVGKTSIVLQFYKSKFETSGEPTIGAAYVTKSLQTENGNISLHVWDTAGQERFKSVIPMYMRGCSAVVLVCATDSMDSYQSLDGWLDLIDQTISAPDKAIYLVLNKIDLAPEFDVQLAAKWAQNHGCQFFQTSAKDKDTIDPLFQAIAENLARANRNTEQQLPPVEGGPGEHRNSCCT